jgi:hypothetical protein
MATPDPEETVPGSFWQERGIGGTLPLLVLTAGLFFGCLLAYLFAPHVGPGGYPLWGLLLTLGFIAAIGATISAYYAAGETRVEPEPTRPPAAAIPREFGRPRPDILRTPSSSPSATGTSGPSAVIPDWDESSLPASTPRRPSPVLRTPGDPGEIERALTEIETIQAELETRPVPSGRARAPAARP